MMCVQYDVSLAIFHWLVIPSVFVLAWYYWPRPDQLAKAVKEIWERFGGGPPESPA
jgi:hypothetical protein